MIKRLNVIGLMSGTSLDGLDLAFCRFETDDSPWIYTIEETKFIPYSDEQREFFFNLETASARELAKAHADYGRQLGGWVRDFAATLSKPVDLVASHGQTLFHQPELGFTFQLGHGAYLATTAQLPVVSDFRSGDVGLGGQGAPLVPIGDQALFAEYDICLNLGGIANLSFDQAGTRLAYDVCPVNLVLNHLAARMGHNYDRGGILARSGTVNPALLNQLDSLSYYQAPFPKSLGKEWIEKSIFPMIDRSEFSVPDLLATCCEHISAQLARSFQQIGGSKVLVTGGGAYNTYLIERLQGKTAHELIQPSAELMDYKEALLFAFLGALRWSNRSNTLASVTGAQKDHCGGAIYLP